MADNTVSFSPDQITDAWLTEVLADAGVIVDGRVTRHSLWPVEVEGQAAETVRVELSYDRPLPYAPSSIVAKFASAHEATRELAGVFRADENEVNFYREFGSDAGIPVPICHHAQMDQASGHFAILLEDMRDGVLGTNVAWREEQWAAALDHLASFHARWWQSDRVLGSPWLTQPDDREYHSGRISGMNPDFREPPPIDRIRSPIQPPPGSSPTTPEA